VENLMATVYIENRAYEADPNRNLLDVCLGLGFNLPYFCWHPALGSAGACRQCAVKQYRDEQDTRGKLVMACLTPAADGTRISIDDAEAAAFRKGVIEGLMLNHPHDCPVCDEGGECHLQDMTVMTGHACRRSRFPKRTFRNQYLGPLVNHEMNRCIQCYRCVRFYRDYAGGHDLNAFGLRNLVYFGRYEDGVLENEFSGNLVEVCPTGVFTDATLKQHYTRKWDLQFAPSICGHCGLGCNTSPGERYGTLRRVVNRYNHEVNGYFLCDRGRYGYEFATSERRVRAPLLEAQTMSPETAVQWVASLTAGPGKVIGIGSPRASLEANFALRTMVGPELFFAGVAGAQFQLLKAMVKSLRSGPARTPSLHDIETSDAVLILGEDVTNVAPRMALALRQSVRQQTLRMAGRLNIPAWNDQAVRDVAQGAGGPLFIATPAGTRLDDIAAETYRAAPDEIARMGFAIAHAVDASAPDVRYMPESLRAMAGRIGEALRGAERPLVVAGASLGSAAIIDAAANVAHALIRQRRPAGLSYIVPECNSMGLALMGGGALEDAFAALDDGIADTVVILENDLYRRAPAAEVSAFFAAARHVIVLDSVANASTAKARVVLPAATLAESSGTLVSNEGRAQRFFEVAVPGGDIRESWRWLRDAMVEAGRERPREWRSLDQVIDALAAEMPVFARIREAAPPSTFRLAGGKVPREPHRYSGRTAMLANISVHEPAPPADADSPLAFSMEGSPGQPPAPLVPFFWSPGWNSIQSVNRFQEEIAGAMRGGNEGVRLIEPSAEQEDTYFSEVPTPFVRREDEWLLVPLDHIFGSDELSRLAPAIAALAPEPYIALNAADGGRFGGEAAVSIGDTVCRLPVKIWAELPDGVAALYAGTSAIEGVALPAWGKIAVVT
jgi:NADH-quinone oxidoreductase subunit G